LTHIAENRYGYSIDGDQYQFLTTVNIPWTQNELDALARYQSDIRTFPNTILGYVIVYVNTSRLTEQQLTHLNMVFSRPAKI